MVGLRDGGRQVGNRGTLNDATDSTNLGEPHLQDDIAADLPLKWPVAEVKDVAVNLNLRPVSAVTLRGGASVKP